MRRFSLQNLRVFESAARHCSFRAAAEELHLSVSAISHAIRKLETGLGTLLFVRAGRSVHLTSDGETLLRFTARGFDEIARGLELVGTREKELLRIHCAPSFAAQWLTPRLGAFIDSYPGIGVRLSASAEAVRFPSEEFDVDICYGLPSQVGMVVMSLGLETVSPLCAPALAATIRSPSDLLGRVLIDSDFKKIRWSDWLMVNNIAEVPPRAARFDRSFLSISAAVEGLGIALESTRLAERELREGRLVQPLAGVAQDIAYPAHYLVFPQAGRQRKGLGFFVGWLKSMLGLSEGSTEADAFQLR
jgi:LysR family transcriptional regulator, glycine cleavage system transcriptional activator